MQDLGTGSEPENLKRLNRFFGHRRSKCERCWTNVELDISSNYYQNSILVDTRRCLIVS